MPERKDKKNQIWAVVFTVIPVVLLSKLNIYFSDDSTMQLLFAALFGGIGGLMGGGLYALLRNQSVMLKVLGVILIASLCAGILVLAEKGII
jgi:hypothetical protein